MSFEPQQQQEQQQQQQPMTVDFSYLRSLMQRYDVIKDHRTNTPPVPRYQEIEFDDYSAKMAKFGYDMAETYSEILAVADDIIPGFDRTIKAEQVSVTLSLLWQIVGPAPLPVPIQLEFNPLR